MLENRVDDISFGMHGLRPSVILGLKMVGDECSFVIRQVAIIHKLNNTFDVENVIM
jgi:hypothetical protein